MSIDSIKEFGMDLRNDALYGKEVITEFLKNTFGRKVNNLTPEVARFKDLNPKELENEYQKTDKKQRVMTAILIIVGLIALGSLILSITLRNSIFGYISAAALSAYVGVFVVNGIYIHRISELGKEAKNRNLDFHDGKLVQIKFVNS